MNVAAKDQNGLDIQGKYIALRRHFGRYDTFEVETQHVGLFPLGFAFQRNSLFKSELAYNNSKDIPL